MGEPVPARVSARVFSLADHHAWWRIVGWIRTKYQGKTRCGTKELRRRFCGTGVEDRPQRVVFTGASKRRRDPPPPPRQHHTDPVDPKPVAATIG